MVWIILLLVLTKSDLINNYFVLLISNISFILKRIKNNPMYNFIQKSIKINRK